MTPLAAAHVDGPYKDWLEDPAVMRFIEAGRSAPDRADMSTYISSMNASTDNLLLGIFAKDSELHIGNIKLGSIDSYHGRADIGLIIGNKSYWKQGYATEAIAAVAEYAGSTLGIRRVFAGCHASNEGSVKAFLNAGFEIEGRLREHARDGDRFVDGIIVGRLLI